MMIRVMLKDGTDQKVFPQVLDGLLHSGRVMFFERAAGWAVVGRDAVRGEGAAAYGGPERRMRLH